MSVPAPKGPLARALAWRIPAAAAGALALAVTLAILALGLTGHTGELIATASPTESLGLAFLPTLGLVLSTLIGMITGTTVIACLVRQVAAGQSPRLGASWARAWSSLHKVAALGAASAVVLVLTLALWPFLTAGVLVRAGWRLRNPAARADDTNGPTNGLWFAVPFAISLTVLAAIPSVWGALVAGTPWRTAGTAAARQPLRTRVTILVGIVAMGVASWVLGMIGLHYTAAPGASTGDFAAGTAVLGLTTATLIALTGILLGLLTHTQHDPPPPAGDPLRISRATAFGRFWRPARLVSTASLAIVAMLLPTGIGVLGAAASAFGEADSDFVVNTTVDSVVVNAGDCSTPGAVCGIRAALAKAAAAAGLGQPAVVRLDISGTITLAATLRVGSGVTVNAHNDVTLDAHHAFAAFETFIAQASEGGTATLLGLTVTGGRSVRGGAGLFSDSTRVRLEQMTFTDNVSDSGDPSAPVDPDAPPVVRDGGAVAVPYTTLRVTDSTFSDNQALSGVGGAVAAQQLIVANSTFVNNSGVSGRPEGGAVFSSNGGSVTHATIIGGGGVSGSENTPLQVVNSAVSTPPGGGAFPCARTTSPSDDTAPSVGNVDAQGTCLNKVASLSPIGDLADNGGPTRTVALLPGSAAIGAADPDRCAPTDQRGNVRDPQSCDAGSLQTTVADIPKVNVALTVGPNPAGLGSPITLEANLTSGAAIPAGSVRFLDGTSTLVENVTVDSSQRATTTIASFRQGPHQLTAEFVATDGTPVHPSPTVKLVVRAPVTLTLTAPDPTKIHAPATVTAIINISADEAGTPAPSGKVTFTNGTTTEQVAVTNGTATWDVAALERADVLAVYGGDDFHDGTSRSADVTTEDLPTTTTASAVSDTVEFGSVVIVKAEVTDTVGAVDGQAQLVVDDVVRATPGFLSDGRVEFGVTMTPGPHTVRVVAVPSAGWSPSSSAPFTVTVTPAAASVTLDAPTQLVWGDPAGFATAHLTGTGPATVRLLDGDTVLGTTVVSAMPGPAYIQIPSLGVGSHSLVAEIVGSATTAGATSTPVTLEITKAPSYIGLLTQPSWLGVETYIDVYSRGGGAEGTLSLTNAEGTVLAMASMATPFARLTWTPAAAGNVPLTVTLTPDPDSNFLPTSETTGLNIAKTFLAAPTMSWTAVPVAGATALTINFGDNIPPPTGLVTLTDSVYGVMAQGFVSAGDTVLNLYGPVGECYCGGRLHLTYGGDSNYEAATYPAPDVGVPAHVTTTTLSALPATVAANGVLYLSARTESPTSPFLATGTMVFAVNGVDLPAVVLPPGDLARTTYQTYFPGQLTVTARFVPDNRTLAASTSEPGTTTVSPLNPPEVTASTTDAPIAGKPFTLRLVATRYGFNIADGAAVAILDGNDNVVGTGTWTSGGFGTSANVSVTPRSGGPNVLVAHYLYGDAEPGASVPFSLTVGATRTQLALTTTTTNPVVGMPVHFTATFDSSSTPDLIAARMRLQLNANGVAIGSPVTLERWQTSIAVTAPATERGSVVWSVTTTGDGTSFGDGAGYLNVTSTGAATTLGTPSDQIIQKRVWSPTISLTGQGNLPAPTGLLWLRLTNVDGLDVAGCSAVLPANSCDIATVNLKLGTYGITVEYSGDGKYEPKVVTTYGQLPSTLRVYSQSSSINTVITPDVTTWQVGQQVKVAWTVDDPDNVVPTGNVLVTYGGAPLCTAPATAGSCTFAAPDNPLRDSAESYRYTLLYATFTPDEALPSERWTAIPPPRRCVPLTVLSDSVFGAARSAGAPGVSGVTCGNAGTGGPGYLEGTSVRITAPNAPVGYKATSWHVETTNAVTGPTAYDADAYDGYPLILTVTGDPTTVTAVLDWAPVCVTVMAGDESRRSFGWLPTDNPERNPDYFNPGRLDLITPSNCASPLGMSAEERLDFAGRDGLYPVGHYAVGTEIDVMPVARRTSGSELDPQYQALGVPNTTPADATHAYPHTVVTEGTYLYGTFRIAPSMCTPVKLYAGIGGKLNVVATKRNFRQRYADPSGHCFTATGEPGYLAYTTIDVKATPASPAPQQGHFVNRWLDSPDMITPAARAANLMDVNAVDYPAHSGAAYVTPGWFYYQPQYVEQTPYNPQYRTFKVPLRAGVDAAHFGVAFAEVRCVVVDVSFAAPVRSYRDNNLPAISVTAPDCGTRGSFGWGQAYVERGQVPDLTPQMDNYTGQLVRNYTGQGRYQPGTVVTATVNETTVVAGPPRTNGPFEVPAPAPFSLIPGAAPRHLSWRTANNAQLTNAVTTPGMTATVDTDTWLRGSYVPDTCRTPSITTHPAGYGYRIRPESFGACPDGLIDPHLTTQVDAVEHPNLTAVWTVGAGRQNEGDFTQVPNQYGYSWSPRSTYVKGGTFLFNDTMAKFNAMMHPVDLYYCAPLKVSMNLTDFNGAALDSAVRRALLGPDANYAVGTAVDPKDYLGNGGDCPAPMMAGPGQTVQVGLNGNGATRFTYKGSVLNGVAVPEGTVPQVKVKPDGTTTDTLYVGVTPRCFTLTLGSKVAPTTPPNCPGAGASTWKYLPGTPVVMGFTGDAADTFFFWTGTDAADGRTAAVIMNRDRSVSADFRTASGVELAVKILTNIEQRIISALITAATGFAAGFLYVAQVAALAVVGVATVLEWAGVSGQAIDTMQNFANAVQSGIDVVNSVADCTQTWATGGGAPPFSPSEVIAQQSIGAGSDVAGEFLDRSGHETTSGVFSSVVTAYNVSNMFATGLEAYLQEPSESWANIVDIGSCVATSGRNVANAAVQLGS